MYIDLDKNLQYYSSEQSVPFDCKICKCYYKQIKDKYPEIAEYLTSLNVDVLRPFELVWFENERNNQIEYVSCQYVVFGTCDNNFKKQIGGVVFEVNTEHHSDAKIVNDEYFIIDFGKIVLELSI